MELTSLFSEKQRFRQIWIWGLFALIIGAFLFEIIRSLVSSKPLPEEPVSFIIPAIVLILVFALIFIIRLETVIKEDGIYYKFYPLHVKYQSIPWNRISRCFVRKYKPILEYGGWGFRMGVFGSGGALNISGNQGLQIVYDDGKKLLIGTQKRDEMETVLRKLGKLTTV